MSEPFAEMVAAARDGRLVVFCGAGVSMLAPSRSPSWWEIYVAAARALADRLREGFPTLGAEVELDALLAPMKTQQLADLVFSRFAGPTFGELLRVVDIADPNENHRAVATLAALGGLRGAVSTNFDTLIERAAAVRGVRFAVAAPGIAARLTPEDHAVLVKLHGTTVEPASLIETTQHKAREISPTLREAWLPMLAGADLLVVGYSGADLHFGAARELFADALKVGGRIWWLSLPGSPPTLTPTVATRTTLVEGRLPDLLRHLVAGLGESDYETPVTGRDAQAALRREMERWSKSLHVERWAAAVFFFVLCERAQSQQASSREVAETLLAALLRITREHLPRFEPGSAIDLTDLGAAAFFSAAGMHQLQRMEIEDARLLLRAAVNIHENTHAQLKDYEESHDERRMNLSSSWNNYAQACLFAGETESALQAFKQALEHAYFGGVAHSFLISLGNLLHYGSELKEVRRSLRIARAAVSLADRIGAVQSSIELRSLLGLYACGRSEIWSAREWLEEANRLATATGDGTSATATAIQLGECEIRAGGIAAGLGAIAEAIVGRIDAAFLLRPIEETRRYLTALGIEQPNEFMLRLSPSEVPGLAAAVESERTRAKQSEELPFGGKPFAISQSAQLGKGDGEALVQIGYLDFVGDREAAAEHGLGLAEWLVKAGEVTDAGWVASNVRARPGLTAARRARAEAVLARCAAASGRPAEARKALEAAREHSIKDEARLPSPLGELGLWVEVQAGKTDAAVPWAEYLAEELESRPQQASEIIRLVAQLESWGPESGPVVAALRAGLLRIGVSPPVSTVPDPARRFRPLRPVPVRERPSDPGAHELLLAAREALAAGEPARALGSLQGLQEIEELPEHQLGTAIEIQLQAIAASRPRDDLEAQANALRRRLLGRLAFGALARLETSLIWIDVRSKRFAEATQRIRRFGWIAELTDEATSRVSLQVWAALGPRLLGEPLLDGERIQEMLQAARYLDLPEASLGDLATTPLGSVTGSDPLAEALQPFYAVLNTSEAAEEVDAALGAAVARLRRSPDLRRGLLARLRGERANWALRRRRFEEAERGFLRVERSFRRLGLDEESLNARAGRARALSRSGRYAEAVELFQRAVEEAPTRAMRANFLIGLGSAHVLEASRRVDALRDELLDQAVSVYGRAIETAPLGSTERANARLALARALGEKGEQESALATLDLAIAELSHLRSPAAKTLQDHRDQFVTGAWQTLGLI